MTIKEICSHFDIGGEYVGCEENFSGNINNTFKVTFMRDGEIKEYILQKINKNVFKEPEKVMENIVRITDHIREKVIKRSGCTRTGVLRAFPSLQSRFYYVVDDVGEYWRCYRYIRNSTTYDACDDLSLIEKMGVAFGKFQNDLIDFNAESLYITIPDFHDTKKRYNALRQAIALDPLKRVKKVENEIFKLLSFEEKACLLQEYIDNNQIPLRVTHNDTKCNNVSFDKDTGELLAVLDLDTVMPGVVAHDFGDAIRFIANTRKEDDPNYKLVKIDLDKFESFTKGFVGEIKGLLTDLEKQTLVLGAFNMTVEVAVRFLTDYILGDVYFRNKYPGHNVDRTKNQIALAEDMFVNFDKMQEIVNRYL